jgi:hypothetical protein
LVRIRHFGFLANRVRRHKLIQCRALLSAPAAPIPIDPDASTTVRIYPLRSRSSSVILV